MLRSFSSCENEEIKATRWMSKRTAEEFETIIHLIFGLLVNSALQGVVRLRGTLVLNRNYFNIPDITPLFSDLHEMGDSANVEFNSESSNQSYDLEDESELQSMTGMGIKHLCSELIELKMAADEDFHRNTISNYSAFIRIFGEAETIKRELMKLKSHVSTQKSLMTNMLNGIPFKILCEEVKDSCQDNLECEEISTSQDLEVYINNVSETLDIFICEKRFDEALEAIEREDETFQRLQLEEYYPLELLLSLKSVISEAKARLEMNIGLMADNPQTAASEIQKMLVGLYKLGDCQLATKLLFRYYHSRIATKIKNLQSSMLLFGEAHIRLSARYIFSMIGQSAKCFWMLHGETSPYSSDLFQWAYEEIQVFIGYLGQYVKSVLEMGGEFSMAVNAIFLVKTFCSLLEAQQLYFQSYLIKLISPCMEEALMLQADRIRSVMNTFAASENWVLGRYLLSGILNGGSSAGKQPEFFLLTISGQQFLSQLQAFIEEVSPLIALHMEGLILYQLTKLFDEYRVTLKMGITSNTLVDNGGDVSINAAETLQQQVSILANLSTIQRVFFLMTKRVFGKWHANSEPFKNDFVGHRVKELDSYLNRAQEDCDQLRALFCQQFINKTMSFKGRLRLIPEIRADFRGSPTLLDIMPSVSFQVLFLELRKLEQLAEGHVFEVDWLIELLRELIENIFVWLTENKDRWEPPAKNLTLPQTNNVKQGLSHAVDDELDLTEHCYCHWHMYVNFKNQFWDRPYRDAMRKLYQINMDARSWIRRTQHSYWIILDVRFLVEFVKFGGYFSDYPLILTTFMKSLFLSAKVDPKTEKMHDVWARRAACEAIEKLIEIEKTLSLSIEERHSQEANVIKDDKDDSSYSDDWLEAGMDMVATDMASENYSDELQNTTDAPNCETKVNLNPNLVFLENLEERTITQSNVDLSASKNLVATSMKIQDNDSRIQNQYERDGEGMGN